MPPRDLSGGFRNRISQDKELFCRLDRKGAGSCTRQSQGTTWHNKAQQGFCDDMWRHLCDILLPPGHQVPFKGRQRNASANRWATGREDATGLH